MAGRADDALRHRQRFRGQPRRGHGEQRAPRLGRRLAQRQGGDLDRLAGDGRPLVGRARGVAEHHRTASSATSSSSATICASAVRMPVPRSTWPLKAATLPSSKTATKTSSSSRAFAARRRARHRRRRRVDGQHALLRAGPRRARACAARAVTPRASAGRAPHRGEDLQMRAAAAEVMRQRRADLRLRRARVAPEQRDRRHDHAVEAVAALRALLGDEGGLDGVRRLDGAEPLQRRDPPPLRPRKGHHAGPRRPPIHEHRAGAALAEAAAVFRAVQPEVVAQHRQQRRRGIEAERVPLAVHLQHDVARGRHTARYRRRASSSARSAAMVPDQTTAPFSTTVARSAMPPAKCRFCSASRIVSPSAFSARNGRRHLLDDDGRQALAGLVQQHQARVAHQGAGDGQHLLLAAAHAPARPVPHAARGWGTARRAAPRVQGAQPIARRAGGRPPGSPSP